MRRVMDRRRRPFDGKRLTKKKKREEEIKSRKDCQIENGCDGCFVIDPE